MGGITKQRHALAERGHDFYETPPEAVDAVVPLLEKVYGGLEARERPILDPCAGRGAILARLREHGFRRLTGIDIVNRNGDPACKFLHMVGDFLDPRVRAQLPKQSLVVMNPPYRDAEAFVHAALEISQHVFALLRLQFLEGQKRFETLFSTGALLRVYVFSKRIPMMHRDGWDGPRASSAVPHAWYHFVRPLPVTHTPAAEITWIKETGE